KTLFERINKLIELGNGYIILQGGTGTLLELAAVWEYSNKGLLDQKPIACHSKIWKVIVSEMNQQMKLEGRSHNWVKTFETIDEVVDYFNSNLKKSGT
ncbi:MAG: LOG family protein, partial [Ignavibacteriaceae bacterium]|nr:LOG family protein [Ignavibacteriaceae bacterium]